jgi:Tol biopolymer transport system component
MIAAADILIFYTLFSHDRLSRTLKMTISAMKYIKTPNHLPASIPLPFVPMLLKLIVGAGLSSLLLITSTAVGQVQLMSERHRGSPQSDAVSGCFRETAPGGTSNPHRTGRPISDDGRYIVFQSLMDGLDPLDNNGLMDVFRRDLQTGITELVSVNFNGDASGNGVSGDYDTAICQNAMISSDGRYVAFHSFASDLVDTDSNGDADVFRRDMQTGTTEMVSINAAGTDSGGGASRYPVMSPDGRFIAFTSNGQDFIAPPDAGFNTDVFVRDMNAGTTQWASVAMDGGPSNRTSEEAAISDDGRYVAFRSTASDLHALDNDTNLDIFQRDLVSQTTALVSIDTLGTGSSDDNSSRQISMSGDGRYVVFKSRATNLVTPDSNNREDVFAWDRDAAMGSQISLVSANQTGTDSGNTSSDQGVISRDGSRIAFRSAASDLDTRDDDGSYDVYARDTSNLGAETPSYFLVSATPDDLDAGGSSHNPAISADGRHVVFRSNGNDIIELDTAGEDVFVRDLQAGVTALASPNSGGTGSGNDSSDNPAISGDGGTVAYRSDASDLVANDINARGDVFAFSTSTVSLLSVRDPGIPVTTGNDRSWVESRSIVSNPRRRQLSDDGRYAVFVSEATDLDPQNSGSGRDNVYRRDLQLGVNELVNIDENGLIPASGESNEPSISRDGNRVAFRSSSSLLASDPTGTGIYVRDMRTGAGYRYLCSRHAHGRYFPCHR